MPETFPPCQKAPSVRGLSPLGDWGSPACCSLLPSRLSPYHLPQRGRLFFGPETFPLCQKAPSVRGLSPLGDWGSAPPTAHSFRHGCAVPPPSRREAFPRAGNFPSLSRGSLREGAVAVGDWGSYRLLSSLLPSRLRRATSLKEGGFSSGRKLSLFVKRLPP